MRLGEYKDICTGYLKEKSKLPTCVKVLLIILVVLATSDEPTNVMLL